MKLELIKKILDSLSRVKTFMQVVRDSGLRQVEVSNAFKLLLELRIISKDKNGRYEVRSFLSDDKLEELTRSKDSVKCVECGLFSIKRFHKRAKVYMDECVREWDGDICPTCYADDSKYTIEPVKHPIRHCRKCKKILSPARYFNCVECAVDSMIDEDYMFLDYERFGSVSNSNHGFIESAEYELPLVLNDIPPEKLNEVMKYKQKKREEKNERKPKSEVTNT